MFDEDIPVHHRPSFWAGIGLALFGLLLWAYPELLSVLVGAFFVALGGILIARALFRRRKWDVW